MATRREQVESVLITRRRVLGALLDPESGLEDEAAPRPVRVVVGSAVVAVAGLMTAAVLAMFHPTAPEGWRGDLISDREGTRYVVLDGHLHPVLNLASAKLILGRGMTKADVPDRTLDPLKQQLGAAVGIPGAPETLPRATDLDLKDWSVCSATSSGPAVAGQTVVEVGYSTSGGLLGPSQALLVQDEHGRQYVVTAGTKYEVRDRDVLVAFNVPTLKPRPVKASWLSGLPSGDPLGVPGIVGNFGATRHPAPAGFDRVGMFGKTIGADGSSVYYIVSGDGLAVASATTYELYQREPRLAQFRFTETILAQSRITQAILAPPSAGLSWPPDPPRFAVSSQNPVTSVLCEGFDGTYDPFGHPHLVVSVAPSLPRPVVSTAGSSTSGHGVADVVSVMAGHGVIARGDSGAGFLITDTGLRYELLAATQGQLGYEGVAPAEVPPSWLKLIPSGPKLDPEKAALSPSM